MNHTKEPWYEEYYTCDEPIFSGEILASPDDCGITPMICYGVSESNARRIVDCVNACADVEDDCLKQGYVKWLQQRIVELELSVMNLEEENARMKAMNNHLVTNGEWSKV